MPSPMIQETIASAQEQHRAGRLRQAEDLYRQALRENADQVDALHGMGIVLRQTGRHALAAAYFGRCVQLSPAIAAFHFNQGDSWLAAGEPDQAAVCFRQAMRLDPNRAEPHLGLGMALQMMHRQEQAIQPLRRAIALGLARPDVWQHLSIALLASNQQAEAEAAAREVLRERPDAPDALYVLGEASLRQARAGDAVAAFRRAAELKPDFARAQQGLGAALMQLGKLDDAGPPLRTAVRLQPDFPEALASLGSLLLQQQKLEEGIDLLGQSVRLAPHILEAQIELARGWELAGRREEAAAVYREIDRRWPGNAHVKFQIAALTGQDAPAAMPVTMVSGMFDRYAPNFDEHLTRRLRYRVPQMLLDAVVSASPSQGLSVLDLGCGTGLCGELFRPLARELIGIDLAPAMLEKARERSVYDRLECADVTTTLLGSPGAYDLIVAGDVLCYMGDLAEIFRAALAALRPSGLFALSVESHEGGGSGWALLPTRRYAHSQQYIRDLAIEAGYEIVALQASVLRADQDRDINGLIVLLRRPAGHQIATR